MTYKVLIAEDRKPHYCDLPGWWRRRKQNLGLGSVIECDCGKAYTLTYYIDTGYYWAEQLRPWRRHPA